MKVLCFGEILWDLIEGTPHLGGAPFNFAAHFAKCGNQAALVSSVGNDNLGWRALNEAKRMGVDCSFVSVHPKAPTGTVDVFLHKGEPDYIISENVAFDHIVAPAALFEETYDIAYFGTLAQRQPGSARTLRDILGKLSFEHIFYDVNLRKGCWTTQLLHESLSLCTILKLNTSELEKLSHHLIDAQLDNKEFCTRLSLMYPSLRTIIITDGANGCFIFHDGKFEHIAGVETQIVDTVGAGDAFGAVFMHLLAHTGDAYQAASMANTVGSFVTGSRGAIPEYPEEIRQSLLRTIAS